MVGNAVSQASNILGRSLHAIVSAVTDVLSHAKEALLPRLKVITQELVEAAKKMLANIIDIIANVLVKIAEILKIIEPLFEVIGQTVLEELRDVAKAVSSVLENIKNAILQQFKHLQHEMKSSAIISDLKAQIHDVSYSEY